MSLDIDWSAITGGKDGAELAETVRAFVHDKFQEVPLPRFLKAVEVHGFDFGQVPPHVELKDICDPLDDFYEDEEADDSVQEQGYASDDPNSLQHVHERTSTLHQVGADAADLSNVTDKPGRSHSRTPGRQMQPPSLPEQPQQSKLPPPRIDTDNTNLRTGPPLTADHLKTITGLRSSTSTPGIPGGTSNLNYFHLPLSAGLSGTTTPLAAVAGAHFPHSWADPNAHTLHGQWQGHGSNTDQRPTASASSLTPPSTAGESSRPVSQHQHAFDGPAGPQQHHNDVGNPGVGLKDQHPGLDTPAHAHTDTVQAARRNSSKVREARAEDMQVVAHVTYRGDVKLSLTAEILLDYPTQSFVGIPLQLTITGLSFDGIAILAYIQRRAHFCFLSPEDAGLFGGPSQGETQAGPGTAGEDPTKFGGLLEELHVESEIGERGGGKQVLKNVGKVEKFILEQVRRIFDDEFVYPSFWTFLV